MSTKLLQKVAIAIDRWKLPIFERHLKDSGYMFGVTQGLVPMSYLLKVETVNVEALAEVIKAANTEAAKTGDLK